MEILEKLESFFKEADSEIRSADSLGKTEELRVKYLGRKSEITVILKGLGALPAEERPKAGKAANDVKQRIDESLEKRNDELAKTMVSQLARKERIDITEPGVKQELGHLHPITQLMMELEDIFTSMGFTIAAGPEIELEYYNFEALNIPADHPARDIQDTIWTTSGTLLRTHTSGVQVRSMEKWRPPIRVVAPGRVFRYERTDASHEHTFYQLEGLMIDRGISVANLIAVMKTMLGTLMGGDVNVRLRPGYFPFVEPGFELDINCRFCAGKGCSVCKKSGWVELLGCGLVHPNVLKAGKIDPAEFSGFAFGMGIDRLVMARYGIDDIRLFHGGDMRFLEQF
jgi:phenylalanyl-tRNA synthetase alpha chain